MPIFCHFSVSFSDSLLFFWFHLHFVRSYGVVFFIFSVFSLFFCFCMLSGPLRCIRRRIMIAKTCTFVCTHSILECLRKYSNGPNSMSMSFSAKKKKKPQIILLSFCIGNYARANETRIISKAWLQQFERCAPQSFSSNAFGYRIFIRSI